MGVNQVMGWLTQVTAENASLAAENAIRMERERENARVIASRLRMVSAALLSTTGIDPRMMKPEILLGDFAMQSERFEDPAYVVACAARGKPMRDDLDRVLAAIDSEEAVTRSHDVDLNSEEKKNVLLVLLMQPTSEDCDQLVEGCGMRPYNSVSNKSPVCTFAGTVAPRDVAALIVRYGGVLLPNPKPQTFGQPQRARRRKLSGTGTRSVDTADTGAESSSVDADSSYGGSDQGYGQSRGST